MTSVLHNPSTMIDRLIAFFNARDVETHVVGGMVRDRLLGRNSEVGDIDLAIKGDAVALGRELAEELGGSLAPLSVPRGMMRVALPPSGQGDEGDGSNGTIIDLSGYSGDIESDLARRDFTINAMAIPLREWQGDEFSGAVLDPFGGRRDLIIKAIRALNPDVFEEDPGRLLRAVRLSGELGMRIEPDTVRLLMSNAELVRRVSPDRVRDEFLKILAPQGARGRIEALDQLGMLKHIIPELMAAKGVDQPRMHYWDVWGHTLHTVQAAEGVTGGHQNSPVYFCVPWTPDSEAYFAEVVSDGHTRRTILKLAALFHDIAKPQTKTLEPDGRTRFFGHSEQGAEVAERRLTELRLSNRGVDMVSGMVLHHLRPTGMSNDGEWPTDRAIYRYFRDTGGVAVDTLFLCLADYLGAKGPELSHPEWLEHAKMISHVLFTGTREPVAANTARLVSGHDLMSRFQLQPGSHIGFLLETIEEARAAGEIETQEQALELAAATIESQGYSRDGSRASSV
ncbi:CC-adding tRNA nucleotidyltransferase [Geodia barretti]|uniref:CC-adding tRNA nucleotidyltransferase n=1 Tax=Geodia barretti TaxID=519541 RepID=A0AA35R6I5_GEOBA|nr:CC-adding tRNA nucleotidyltransferase [Geodia barretti]